MTQSQIAKSLGISQPAVGVVLGHHSYKSRIRVHPETRRRILDTAHRLGYRPDRYASIMSKGKSSTIAMLQFGGLQFVNEMRALHAARAIHRQQFRVLSHNVHWHIEGVQNALDAILDARAEGLLLVGPTEIVPSSFLSQIRKSEIPVVSLSGVHFEGVPQVRSNFRQGMSALTNHLLSLGYRKLVLLTQWASQRREEAYNWPVLERVQGFEDAAASFGPDKVNAEVVCGEASTQFLAPYQGGKQAMAKLLQRHGRPEAVLCNDAWAIGALAACAEAGVKVPKELAVTGFDNDLIGEFSNPTLTTVAQPVEAMANRAVELLVKQIRGERLSTDETLVKMPCQLVVRQSAVRS